MGRNITPEERRRRSHAAKWAALLRRRRERFYIALSCKDSWDPDALRWPGSGSDVRGAYRRFVWPKLFPTRKIAEQAAEILRPFRATAAVPGRGRVVSYTIEKTLLPERVTS